MLIIVHMKNNNKSILDYYVFMIEKYMTCSIFTNIIRAVKWSLDYQRILI